MARRRRFMGGAVWASAAPAAQISIAITPRMVRIDILDRFRQRRLHTLQSFLPAQKCGHKTPPGKGSTAAGVSDNSTAINELKR
jgi:hypothetical protein